MKFSPAFVALVAPLVFAQDFANIGDVVDAPLKAAGGVLNDAPVVDDLFPRKKFRFARGHGAGSNFGLPESKDKRQYYPEPCYGDYCEATTTTTRPTRPPRSSSTTVTVNPVTPTSTSTRSSSLVTTRTRSLLHETINKTIHYVFSDKLCRNFVVVDKHRPDFVYVFPDELRADSVYLFPAELWTHLVHFPDKLYSLFYSFRVSYEIFVFFSNEQCSFVHRQWELYSIGF
ncbi:hypothetical protein CKM354_000609100 [Cercospora kikuchii]|uniref:Uncharacterized protein n=1 Tax=Cercospora kikuchii TaxID=84275 RepID=A0A9P3CQY6_9PEZI|nr:uncharacterized protein CKM354_000609100 [Cercospora kikuchii]GIZ42838.1 hypothetical protein CKM354_000609100 [Cercospora kikuchii]